MEHLILKAKQLFYKHWMQSGKTYNVALDEIIAKLIKEAEAENKQTEEKIKTIQILIQWQSNGTKP